MSLLHISVQLVEYKYISDNFLNEYHTKKYKIRTGITLKNTQLYSHEFFIYFVMIKA